MPRKDVKEYRAYMREYMRAKRQRLTGINNGINKSTNRLEAKQVVEIGGFEPPTSAMRTQRSPY